MLLDGLKDSAPDRLVAAQVLDLKAEKAHGLKLCGGQLVCKGEHSPEWRDVHAACFGRLDLELVGLVLTFDQEGQVYSCLYAAVPAQGLTRSPACAVRLTLVVDHDHRGPGLLGQASKVRHDLAHVCTVFVGLAAYIAQVVDNDRLGPKGARMML